MTRTFAPRESAAGARPDRRREADALEAPPVTNGVRAYTGSPYEEQFGFARAARVGDRILVAGTGPVEDDGSSTQGGAAAQAERCCVLICRALAQLGAGPEHVTRTRMLLTDPADQDAVGAVHARFFGGARPAATMAGVAWLCRPEWKVEIEAEAFIGAA